MTDVPPLSPGDSEPAPADPQQEPAASPPAPAPEPEPDFPAPPPIDVGGQWLVAACLCVLLAYFVLWVVTRGRGGNDGRGGGSAPTRQPPPPVHEPEVAAWLLMGVPNG